MTLNTLLGIVAAVIFVLGGFEVIGFEDALLFGLAPAILALTLGPIGSDRRIG